MIFVTIGTQAPFDRLVKAIDKIAPSLNNQEIIVQNFKGTYIPEHISTTDFLAPIEFDELFEKADLIVSHAGMGTIISALTKGKKIIIVPRKVDLGEHRNDHQQATAKKIKDLGSITVLDDESKLLETINQMLNSDSIISPSIGLYASESLIKSLQKYIFHDA
jgi:UDP-N-acetylglucosamine transferase subunit ALG13